MCSKGSNTQTKTESQTVTPNADAMAAYKKVIGMADTAVATPYNPDTERQIAGFTAPTFQAFDAVQTAQGVASPYLEYAKSFGMRGGSPITAEDISGYMNPYLDSVVEATQKDYDIQNRRQLSGVTGDARIKGSLGGDREAVAKALTAEAQSRVQSPIIADLRSKGYSTALSAAQGDAQRALGAASQMGQLGQVAQNAAYTDIGQLYGAGGMQQALTQAEYDAAAANAAARAAYPFQQAQWYAGVVNPTGANMGSTTTGTSTTQGPTPNTWSQAAGFGIAAAPYIAKAAPALLALSDVRAKTDIQRVGSMADGTPLYRYRYIDDPSGAIQIGPIAQEVEQRRPDAVADSGPGGLKMVDLAAATDESAAMMGARGYASGGGISAGYIPSIPIASGGGLRPAPLMAALALSTPDAATGFADMAKMTEAGMKGLGEIGTAARTTQSPGGWSTTVNPESAAGWGSYFGSMFGRAAGGAVPDMPVAPMGMTPPASPLALHMRDILEAAHVMRSEMPAAIPHKAEGGELSPWGSLVQPLYEIPSNYGQGSMEFLPPSGALPSAQAPVAAPVALPSLGPGISVGTEMPAWTEAPKTSGWSTTVEPAVRQQGITVPAAAAKQEQKGFFDWLGSDDAVNMLVPIGLGIMSQGAGGKGSFGLNVGRGASEGLKTYNEGENARKNREQQQKRIDMEAERLRLEAEKLAEESRMRGLEHPYRMQSLQAEARLKNAQADATGEGKVIEVAGELVRVKPDGTTTKIYGTSGVEKRRQEVKEAGLDPELPAHKVYIATGKLPKEDQQPLSATDKKAIIEADELVLANRNTIAGLDKALELSKKAYAGSLMGLPFTGADTRSAIASNAPWATPEADATRELKNVITSQALDNLKATFGAAPTEGERKILLEIQGSVDQPQAVREAIYRRAQELARIRLKFNEERAAQLRGGTYYGGTGGSGAWKAQPQSTPQAGSTDKGIDKPNVQQPKSGKPPSEMTNEELLRSLQ